MMTRFLKWFAVRWGDSDPGYPQTWHLVTVRITPVRVALVWLCGVLTGHELSETEWDYGGGPTANRNCRWCDKRFEVPKESIREDFPESAHMIEEFDAKLSVHRRAVAG